MLIVDDIPTNVRLLEARLTAEYFAVSTASSGQAALEACGRGDIDIVLLDVMMPEMDGFEVCQRLKANPQTHHIPVLMVTALDQPGCGRIDIQTQNMNAATKPLCGKFDARDQCQTGAGRRVGSTLQPCERIMVRQRQHINRAVSGPQHHVFRI